MKEHPRRTAGRQLSLTTALVMLASLVKAGIPEPSLVWYGKVLKSSGGAPVRLTAGSLVWQIEPLAGGPAFSLTAELTNINDQFSFVLRVPCETPQPGLGASTNVVNLTAPPAGYRRLTVRLNGQPLTLLSAAGEFSPSPTARGQAERIDLQLGAASNDSDGDGLDDAWELQHFGSLSAKPTDDPDGDGVNNLREFRAGTDPKDARSVFELVEIAKVPSGVLVRWSSQAGHTYRVLRSASLLDPPGKYQVLEAGVAATPPLNEFTDSSVGVAAQFFYRIEVEE